MEDKRNEMMYVDVFADDTGLFTETECDYDNMTTLEVPRWIVEEWYKQNEKEYKEDTMKERGISEEEVTLEKWLYEVALMGDFIGFYSFCIIKGIVPNISASEIDDKVFYLDNDEHKHVVFEGTYNECRRFGKMWNWSYLGYNLQLEIE